ncbi:MAG: hypothetical protein H7067_06190, partial [Burkholderiales bacterium]|nr:hypothetical protein [Opitutaceae bacterium]
MSRLSRPALSLFSALSVFASANLGAQDITPAPEAPQDAAPTPPTAVETTPAPILDAPESTPAPARISRAAEVFADSSYCATTPISAAPRRGHPRDAYGG